MSGSTLDAGALIGFDRNDRWVVLLVREAREHGERFSVPAGALAQVWRDGRTQARLVALLAADDVEIVPLDDSAARAAGQLCGARRTSDIVDASVVLCAKSRGHKILTSDPDDLSHLDATLKLVTV